MGASYLSAQWSGPASAPPGDNTAAPINVGLDFQEKTGDLSITGALGAYGGFVFQDGNEAAGKVLVSDANGIARWDNASSGGGGGSQFASFHWDRNGGLSNAQNIASGVATGVRATITFATPASSTDYLVICNGKGGNGGSPAINAGVPLQTFASTKTTDSFVVDGYHAAGIDTLYVLDCIVIE